MVVMDNSIWHTSMPNDGRSPGGGLDGRSRCTVQINYQSSETPSFVSPAPCPQPSLHMGHMRCVRLQGPRAQVWGDVAGGARVGVTEATLRQLDAADRCARTPLWPAARAR